ncbi:MAG: ABC transporter permease [Planctomycetaceae bacterium]|nr:ABC transporter permease [Planctomycetaceae bacterium]
MLHGTLTLLTRSLRDNARRRAAHFVRLASVLLLLVMLIEAHVASGGLGAPGLRLFQALCYLSIALISLAGPGFFASAIGEEKEEGTLGLLKLADLSSVSILLGKSTSRLMAALTVFAGILPFALLSITLGGLSAQQIWCSFVAIAAFLILVANLALLMSVVCRRTSSASALMLLLLLGSLLLAPALHVARPNLEADGLVAKDGRALSGVGGVCEFLNDVSVLNRIGTILSTGFGEGAMSAQVWASLGGAFAAFAVSCIVFDRFTEYVGATPGGGSEGWWRTLNWRFRRPRPGHWPLVWKDFHFLAGGRAVLVVKSLLYLALLVALFWKDDWIWSLFQMSLKEMAWCVAAALAVAELLICGTKIFRSERADGTLPCLMMLPRNLVSISYAKLGGCLLGSAPTLLMFTVLVTVIPDTPFDQDEFFEGVVPICMGVLVLVHLTVLYSIIVPWGALPLALVTVLVGAAVIGPIVAAAVAAIYSAGHGSGGAFGPVLYAGLILSAALQVAIAIRLSTVAAQ